MEGLTLSIRLDGGERRYTPGAFVGGGVVVRHFEAWQCKYMDVTLGWRTEGRGDEDCQAAVGVRLAGGGEEMSPQNERKFRLKVPQMPWTYHGVLIKIHWVVGVYARGIRGKEVSEEIPIVIHPNPAGIQLPTASL